MVCLVLFPSHKVFFFNKTRNESGNVCFLDWFSSLCYIILIFLVAISSSLKPLLMAGSGNAHKAYEVPKKPISFVIFFLSPGLYNQ